MKASEAFPSKYIAAVDLRGRPMKLIMGVVEMEEVGRERDTKPVLYFKGAQKGLVLNKTNSSCIAAMHGDEMDMWAGNEITIYPTTTDMAGEIVPCIRVLPAGAILPAVPQTTSPAVSPNAPLTQAAQGNGGGYQAGGALDDDIPF